MGTKLGTLALIITGFVGCSANRTPDVAGNVRDGLKQAGLNDVTVSQDRDKGVVTLGGTVPQDADKDRAEQVARPLAAGQVVANQIAVLPPNDHSTAKDVNSDLDKGIEANLDAALREAHIKAVRHDTKNGVVTLKGEVPTPALRASAEKIAAGVPNVQQVVNEIETKYQRATSSSADRSSEPPAK